MGFVSRVVECAVEGAWDRGGAKDMQCILAGSNVTP